MARVVAATAVFEAGRHVVAVKHVENGVPKPVMVATPTDAGAYPVAIFLHGWNLRNGLYECLLRHVASHGFIVVAPRLYGFTLDQNDGADIDTTRELAVWLARGLAGVLDDVFELHGVEPDLARLALAGHSRGGDTAFAVVLGVPTDHDRSLAAATGDDAASPKFSALIGVDPVAGFSPNSKQQTEPPVLTFEPRTLDPGMPVLVIGTGLGPRHIGGVPCAPVGLNHAEFYDECVPPRYHAVAQDYGHLDMLDDDAPYYLNNCMCMRNMHGTKDLARRAIGGLMVAFLKAALEDDGEDLKAVIANPGLAPVVLNPVEHDLA